MQKGKLPLMGLNQSRLLEEDWLGLSSATGMLLDFDGPVCDLFAGSIPRDAAAGRAVFLRAGVEIPREMSDTNGALILLQWAATHAVGLTPELEAIQEAREFQAIATAQPTPHIRNVILAAKRHGMGVAIVSNNSKSVIQQYLVKQDLAHHIDVIAARERGEAHLLKPSPALLLRARALLGLPTHQCVMLGDTTNDIKAASKAQMPSVGFATKPERAGPLARAGASAVFHDMKSVLSLLQGSATD